MSFWSSPRLGIAPGISSKTRVSEVRVSSRKRPCLPEGKCGRQIVLKPVPVHVPGSAASGPSGSAMLVKGCGWGSATAGTGSKAKWSRLMGSPRGCAHVTVPGRFSRAGAVGRPGDTPAAPGQPYSRSITSAYLVCTTRRLSLSVGVSSSDSAVHSTGSSSKALTCSGRDDRGDLPVQGQHRDDVRPVVAERQRVADDRRLLEEALDVAR